MQVPSILRPLGVDLFCLGKKFLVYNMVSRNLKLKYRRSVFGILWTLMTPVAMAGVYYTVFQVILQVQIPHYLIFLLSGVLPWTFFSQTLTEGMESILGNWGLVSKVPIPLQVFSYVCSVTNFFTFILSLPVLILAGCLSGIPIKAPLLLLPILFFILLLITYCLSLILSLCFVYFRDLRHILGIILQLWFYATPILYDESMVPGQYRWLLEVNPLACLFTSFHQILLRGAWPSFASMASVTVWSLALFYGAALFYQYSSKDIVENL